MGKPVMSGGGMTRSERRRIRRWLTGFLIAEAVLVAVFIGCCVYCASLYEQVETDAGAAETIEVVRYATEKEEQQHDRETVEAIAKTVWGEARGCSTTEQAAVVWCILNRADSPEFPDDPLAVVQQHGQFNGYSPSFPVEPEIAALVEDVMDRWDLERCAVGGVGRVLPADYLYFEGNGLHNHFRKDYISSGEAWDWSLVSPYADGL